MYQVSKDFIIVFQYLSSIGTISLSTRSGDRTHGNKVLDELPGTKWDLLQARPDAEKFSIMSWGVRSKVKTSLAFEALKLQVLGHRGNHEDYENYR